MKHFFAIILLATIALGCQKAGGCSPEKFEYTFQTDKQIDTVQFQAYQGMPKDFAYAINNGNSSVFLFRDIYENCPDRTDGGNEAHIVFQIPSAGTGFRIEDSTALQQANAMLYRICGECPSQRGSFFKSGFIEGEKINESTWNIRASLTSSSSIKFEFAALFRKN